MGDCENYGPCLGPHYNTTTGPNLGDPKRDHNFDNPPYEHHKHLNTENSDKSTPKPTGRQ